jgi:DNA replication protein DnaC
MSINITQFKKIMNSYDELRTRNKQILKNRKHEIYNNIPAIKDIDKTLAELSYKTTMAIMEDPSNKEDYISNLKDEIATLSLKKSSLLEINDYDTEYLKPIYNCELCNDTGYINSNKCTCLKQAIINIAYEQSNLKNILAEENFDTFSFDYYSNELIEGYSLSPLDNIQIIYSRCKQFVLNFDSSFSNLILFGQAGLGKTFLCNCIAKELLDYSYTVIYLSAFQLFKLFENYRFRNEDNLVSSEEIDNITSCDLLIIDDLGTEIINSFTSSELFNCLNTRLLQKKSTVISTNLRPNEWSKQYSDRIVSRIFGNYTPLKFFGTDIRMLKYK